MYYDKCQLMVEIAAGVQLGINPAGAGERHPFSAL